MKTVLFHPLSGVAETGLWAWLAVWALEAIAADPPDDDARTMARVAAGDERALEQLFETWKRPLLSFFYRSLGSHADAEDLTLEVFVRLHRAAPTYRSEARFSTFLFHIARNLLSNERRRRVRKPADTVPPELFEQLPQAPSAERGLAELEERLQLALTCLSERDRTAILLSHQQQLGVEAAAAALKVTENAFRVLVHRARQRLKIALEAQP